MSRSVSFVSSPRSGNFLFKILAVVAIAATAFLVESVTAEAEAANPKYAGIVVDAKTGNVLYSENADRLQYPASLTKMMTLYLTFEALEAGRIRLDTRRPLLRARIRRRRRPSSACAPAVRSPSNRPSLVWSRSPPMTRQPHSANCLAAPKTASRR